MPKNSSGIPALRERLRKLAAQHGLDELNYIADQMYRRAHTRRAPTRSPKLTPEMAQKIRDYAAAHPKAHLQDIAEQFGDYVFNKPVRAGRIGQRLPEAFRMPEH